MGGFVPVSYTHLDVYKRQVKNHVGWFVPFNILLNAAVSWSIYFVGRRLSRAKGIGFLCGLMFLISRMAYYQIGQVLGLMEMCIRDRASGRLCQ